MNLARVKDTQLTIAAVAAGVDGAIVESAAIDCIDKNRALFELVIGATAANTGVVDLYFESSSTSAGSYTKMTGAEIVHTHTATGQTSEIYQLDAQLSSRYLKVVYQRTIANTAFLCGILSLYDGKVQPVAQDAAVKEQLVI